jgi:hypothetical protein
VDPVPDPLLFFLVVPGIEPGPPDLVAKNSDHYTIEAVVSDRMSYIILRGRWCHIIVLNVHAPTEDKTDDVKDSFYKELERVFDKFC